MKQADGRQEYANNIETGHSQGLLHLVKGTACLCEVRLDHSVREIVGVVFVEFDDLVEGLFVNHIRGWGLLDTGPLLVSLLFVPHIAGGFAMRDSVLWGNAKLSKSIPQRNPTIHTPPRKVTHLIFFDRFRFLLLLQ